MTMPADESPYGGGEKQDGNGDPEADAGTGDRVCRS
jgi:hypothetical protein